MPRESRTQPDGQFTAGDLYPKELEVLRLVAEGCTNVTIARRLGVAVDTVKSRLKRLYEVAGVHDRAQAVWVLLVPAEVREKVLADLVEAPPTVCSELRAQADALLEVARVLRERADDLDGAP